MNALPAIIAQQIASYAKWLKENRSHTSQNQAANMNKFLVILGSVAVVGFILWQAGVLSF